MLMTSDVIYLYTAREQWWEVLFTIGLIWLFFEAIRSGWSARSLRKGSVKIGQRIFSRLVPILLGIVLGGWYGYFNSINFANALQCNEKSLVLYFPLKQVELSAANLTFKPALAGYRGGHSWRLRFIVSQGESFDTVQIDVAQLKELREKLSLCGLRGASN
jgi:hypothetical protein